MNLVISQAAQLKELRDERDQQLKAALAHERRRAEAVEQRAAFLEDALHRAYRFGLAPTRRHPGEDGA
jgi:hypothetical protein